MTSTQKLVLRAGGAGASVAALSGFAFAESLPTDPKAVCSVVCPDSKITDLGVAFKTISNTLIVIVITVSVIMLIVGGLKYVLSSGNSSSVEGAKNTILYAVIGIIVALLAAAIVNFVVGKFA